jgi:hypothetical protein
VTGEDNATSNVGGVVAVASNSAVLNQVYNTGAITAKNVLSVGGIAGKFVTEASMTSAFNQGQITAEGSTNAGGLIGKAETCKVTGAYNAGVVPAIANAGSIAGASLVYLRNGIGLLRCRNQGCSYGIGRGIRGHEDG